MQCAATGDRPPQFVWERDGVTVSSNTDPRVRVEDGGLYACIAKEGEHVASSENRLDFYGPPYIRSLPPVKAQSGESINLRCTFYGYPISCAQMARRTIKFVSLARKKRHCIMQCERLSSTTSTLEEKRWYKTTGIFDLAYSLTWKEASGPWQEVWSPNKVPNKLSNLSGVQKHALTGLKCGTKYSLRITATNKVGTSQPAYLDVSTLGGPPIAPTSTEWFWSNCSHVFIQAAGWDDAGCELRTLELEHRALGARSWMRPINILSYTGHLYQYRGSFALSGLSAGTWYVLRITATNEAGSVTTVYNYATKNEDGSEVGPPSEIFDINMLVIVLSSILLAVCLICCAYILVKRQRNVNLTGYRDSITVDKSESGNITANTSHSNLANVKENSMNAQNRIYSAPIHVRNNSKHVIRDKSLSNRLSAFERLVTLKTMTCRDTSNTDMIQVVRTTKQDKI
ncbi:unnamed protein product [Danaus chrysippus]|uniref:(African queen) hypothetical protein n=1 Tax=Danaus chrysippus TaxID=151541 RepID=A0A8J2QYY9_9NEOP|nr:unnamed protein product [Danaus chrysippus]